MSLLAQRINELKTTEGKAGDAFAPGLSGRVKEIQASQEMEQQLETGVVSRSQLFLLTRCCLDKTTPRIDARLHLLLLFMRLEHGRLVR
jgi:hypothetical protein